MLTNFKRSLTFSFSLHSILIFKFLQNCSSNSVFFSVSSVTDFVQTEVSVLGTIDILDELLFCWESRMFSSTPGLYLDAGISFPGVTSKNVSRHCQTSPVYRWEGAPSVENHWFGINLHHIDLRLRQTLMTDSAFHIKSSTLQLKLFIILLSIFLLLPYFVFYRKSTSFI